MQLGPWVLPSIQHDAVSVYDYIGPNVFITFNCHVFLQDYTWVRPFYT
ncbi:hypothetical protein RGQ29_023690 [Quercus rubra]|uniref:Uncharacterized protein n=1 Tax=Quercus rubra TaxID=3512 RepID=A0AAN7IRB1_QUERU|nr:hypothetical protein RGQ29_023690 [Quercus rubra]